MDPDPSATGETSARADATGTPPDWPEAARFLRARLRRLLPGAQGVDIEDLTQEALIDLVRTSRREPIRNLDALLNTLARRKAIDLVRRRDRWSVLVRPLSQSDADAITERWRGTDPAERLAFVVLAFFASERSACEPLARALLAGHDWTEVAAAMNLAAAAVRKQWSRCVAHLRRTLMGGAVASEDAPWTWLTRHESRDTERRDTERRDTEGRDDAQH